MVDLNKMTEKEIQAHIDLLEKAGKGITEKLEEAKRRLETIQRPKVVIPFIPQKGDTFYIERDGYIEDYTYLDNMFSLSERGLCFRSAYEVKLSREKTTAEAELLMMCNKFEISEEKCWHPQFIRGKWVPDFCYASIISPYRFGSKESCQTAIDKLGDRKLRLIFNIPLEDENEN